MGLREEKKRAAWLAIRDAAFELFDAQGYEATTVEQIVATAGVSRATFFNYFAGKEAVVFDQDPGERDRWQSLMDDRPDDEPLWDALTHVLLGFTENLRERMPLQRRLKAASPALAQSSQSLGSQFQSDLRDWVDRRVGADDELTRSLWVTTAFGALSTAYATWAVDESFDDYLARVRRCLDLVRPSGGQ